MKRFLNLRPTSSVRQSLHFCAAWLYSAAQIRFSHCICSPFRNMAIVSVYNHLNRTIWFWHIILAKRWPRWKSSFTA